MRRQYLLFMVFAVISTGINLGSQAIIKATLSDITLLNHTFFQLEYYFIIQLLTGTILGFVSKFILDKYYVFQSRNTTLTQTFKQIVLYGLMAILTTLVFWSVEIGFKMIFEFNGADLVGGILGLSIGYTMKFFLDNKFVFLKTNSN